MPPEAATTTLRAAPASSKPLLFPVTRESLPDPPPGRRTRIRMVTRAPPRGAGGRSAGPPQLTRKLAKSISWVVVGAQLESCPPKKVVNIRESISSVSPAARKVIPVAWATWRPS